MNTPTTQWPLLVAVLASLGTLNAVELLELARDSGVETELNYGLRIRTPDDDMSVGNVNWYAAQEGREDNYIIFAQESEEGGWWQFVFGGNRLESDGFNSDALEAWETAARADIAAAPLSPDDKEAALAVLDATVQALTERLPTDDEDDTGDTGCGD